MDRLRIRVWGLNYVLYDWLVPRGEGIAPQLASYPNGLVFDTGFDVSPTIIVRGALAAAVTFPPGEPIPTRAA